MLTSLLVVGTLDQAIVLATSDEPPPTRVPQGAKFFDLAMTKRQSKEGVTEPAFIRPETQSLLSHLTRRPLRVELSLSNHGSQRR